MMLSRFKACLVGAVIGDCIGSVFEGTPFVKINDVLGTVSRIEKYRQIQRENGTRPADHYGFSYTDDTAMARSVAFSLLEKQQFDARDMANRFSEEYFKNPNRGYGGSVVTVFKELQNQELTDVYKPAAMQFGGSGSYGNGGAMRIAPAALFAFHEDDLLKLEVLVSSITRLTHTHPLAINGAILQAFAVDQSLRLPQAEVNADEFIDRLISKMEPIEKRSSSAYPPAMNTRRAANPYENHPTPYCAKLKMIKDLLKSRDLQVEDVVSVLGNDVSAFGSVPAAVMAFLKTATQKIPELDGRSKFEQSIIYAISLGGDTDTIATMTAAIAGALYGMKQIPEAWQYYCEGVADAEAVAEAIFKRGNL